MITTAVVITGLILHATAIAVFVRSLRRKPTFTETYRDETL
jgi:hypothetical protein